MHTYYVNACVYGTYVSTYYIFTNTNTYICYNFTPHFKEIHEGTYICHVYFHPRDTNKRDLALEIGYYVRFLSKHMYVAM